MTNVLKTVISAVILAALGYAGYLYFNNGNKVISQGPTIEKIQNISELATLRISISDVLKSKGTYYSGSFLIKGYAIIGVDVQKAVLQSTDQESKKIVIKLPRPRVISASVDHERSITWDYKNESSWPEWTLPKSDIDAMRDNAFKEGQKLIEQAANKDEHIQMAKGISEAVINNMYKMVDWNVQIIWE